MEWDAYANRKLQFPKCKSCLTLWIKSRFSKVVFYVSMPAVLALLVLTSNIHRMTGAPLHSALGSITFGQFRSATGTLTVTSRKGCPGTLSQTCRPLLWGLMSHSSHPDLAGKRNMSIICLRATKLLQLFLQASGNGPDQWKSISSCNPNTWNFRNVLWNTLWKCNPCHQGCKPKCTFPNIHSPIFTTCNGSPHPIFSILWYKELADPDQKNLLWSPKWSTIFTSWAFLKGVPAKKISKGHCRKH